ncbi:DUF5677 domain-containing protein [Bacillus haynesii]|uniref:DUF5677 domain-containing protein n=1 Tax=Bacillus haynesii TaxID=1925021 RepID=UPI00227E5943|nr:DUF5677 domain-containing protein [Bacillus haynesii]MCY8582770.1 DUF5677 domain-containing protein [Bacillus haynesii]
MLTIDIFKNEDIIKDFKSIFKDNKKIDEKKIVKAIHDKTKENISLVSDGIYSELKADMVRMYTDEETASKEFKTLLHKQWYEGFLILQGIIKFCEDASIRLLKEFSSEDQSDSKRTLILKVLFKLHSKGVQVSKEVLTLLKSGFSDGALARWRSLHELNVILKALSYKFSDIDFTYNLTRRYLDYSEIERIKEIYTFKKVTGLLNLDPISSEDKKKYREIKESIIKKYGKNFEKPNMWAKPLFPNIKDRQIYFSDFEKLVGIDRLNPYYKQANYQIHASPKGIYQSLSMLPSNKQESFYLYGGSNYGISLPGELTGISLSQITISLLLLESNEDRLVMSKILGKFVDDCSVNFSKIQKQIREIDNE